MAIRMFLFELVAVLVMAERRMAERHSSTAHSWLHLHVEIPGGIDAQVKQVLDVFPQLGQNKAEQTLKLVGGSAVDAINYIFSVDMELGDGNVAMEVEDEGPASDSRFEQGDTRRYHVGEKRLEFQCDVASFRSDIYQKEALLTMTSNPGEDFIVVPAGFHHVLGPQAAELRPGEIFIFQLTSDANRRIGTFVTWASEGHECPSRPNTCFLPQWMFESLKFSEGDCITFKDAQLPRVPVGTQGGIKLKPFEDLDDTVASLDELDPDMLVHAVTSAISSKRFALFVGDVVDVDFKGKEHRLEIVELELNADSELSTRALDVSTRMDQNFTDLRVTIIQSYARDQRIAKQKEVESRLETLKQERLQAQAAAAAAEVKKRSLQEEYALRRKVPENLVLPWDGNGDESECHMKIQGNGPFDDQWNIDFFAKKGNTVAQLVAHLKQKFVPPGTSFELVTGVPQKNLENSFPPDSTLGSVGVCRSRLYLKVEVTS